MENKIKKSLKILVLAVIIMIPQVSSATIIIANTVGTLYVKSASAQLKGFVVMDSLGSIEVWFEYGTNSNASSNKTDVDIKNRSTSGNINITVNDLSPGQTYYYKVVARDSERTVTGNIRSFTTGGDYKKTTSTETSSNSNYTAEQFASVTTFNPVDITGSSAKLRGLVNPNRGGDTIRWFEWGESLYLGNVTTQRGQGSSLGSFEEPIVGLYPGRTYYFQAKAKNSRGIVSGKIISFKTGEYATISGTSDSRVVTSAPTNVTSTSAKLNGLSVIVKTSETNGWFEWGSSVSLGNTTESKDIGSATIAYSTSITSLISNKTYYYRAVIKNEFGTRYGSILSFSTVTTTVNTPILTSGNSGSGGDGVYSKTKETPVYATTAVATQNNLIADIGSSGGFFPETIIGWMLILLLLLILIATAQYLYEEHKKRNNRQVLAQ